MTSEFNCMGQATPIDDLDALCGLARKCARRSRSLAIEVGTWAGTTALELAKVFGTVYCVDTWEGSPWEGDMGSLRSRLFPPKKAFQTFCRNVGTKLFYEIRPCVGRSLTWAAIWPFQADLVFIDADHRYEAVKADILAWMPHVRPGGILVLHDYKAFSGVTRAVDELLPGFQKATCDLVWIEVGTATVVPPVASQLKGGRTPQSMDNSPTGLFWPSRRDDE